jgi:pyruvate carboxylase
MARELRRPAPTSSASRTWPASAGPRAARALVKALKEETGLPIHFHTHDTSGIAAASVLAAVEAGVRCRRRRARRDERPDLAAEPRRSIAAALAGTERDPGLIAGRHAEAVACTGKACAAFYAPFESDIRSGTADVYRHEMPGGQYTNLREQARAMGLDHRWTEVSQAYADVNRMFGDIVKVTPTSKVVGDMALMMVANDLTRRGRAGPGARGGAFPESVVSLFKGELGFPRRTASRPTHAFFYGLATGEEISVDIERGKSLVISQQGVAGPDEDGMVRVFFELNGQPRMIRVAKSGMTKARTRPQAEEGNGCHLGAPMPGTIVTVAVHAGQVVSKGDPLVSIEAMKMETMLRADRDGTVEAVHVRHGESVDAKDLLLEFGQ